MALAPPPTTEVYRTLEELIQAVNAHAKSEGYAITKRRTKSNKDGINKAILCCDRGRQYREKIPLEYKQRSTGSRQTGCPFNATAKYDGVNWSLAIKEPTHNHNPSMHPTAHPAHRKVTPTMRQDIANQTAAGTAPRQIESALRLQHPDLTITRDDIRNTRKAIKHDNLGQNSPIQALLLQLQSSDWIHHAVVDSQTRVRNLFFTHIHCVELFRRHPEIVLLDCTYKTNRFGLPLLSMVGLNAMGKSFFIAFAFIQDEKEAEYLWVMEHLLHMFQDLQVRYTSGPEVLVTDRDLGLMAAIRQVFPRVPHLLCTWHINKCVVAKCKLLFLEEEYWTKFYQEWQTVGQQKTPEEVDAKWAQFRLNWLPLRVGDSTVYPEADVVTPPPSATGVEYLQSTWIIYKRKWAQPWTDPIRHFGNRSTSVVEGSHSVLKRYLQVSTGDLKTVVDNISLMLVAQQSSYLADLSGAELRVPFEIKIPPFVILQRFVTPQALRKVLVQYNQLSKSSPLPPCTGVFSKIWGLPCGHALRQSIDSEQALALHTVHSHWHFRPLEQPSEVLLYQAELFAQDPPITQSRGRPRNPPTAAAASRQAAGEIQRQVASQIQREAISSTRRFLSEFELVQRIRTRVLRSGRTLGAGGESTQ